MRESIAIAITEPSQVGEARRAALALANRLGFEETARGKVGIVVTEVATNLVQHTDGGVLLLRAIEHQKTFGIEILSLDKGPGMVNVDECLQDGFSTTGTLGNGLGAIYRLSDFFEIYSLTDKGTALLIHIWSAPGSRLPEINLEIGAICLPKQGENVSGDTWVHQVNGDRHLFLVADGLGHGSAAALAASEAVRVFQENDDRSPQAIIEAAHQVLRSTRGAALAIAAIDLAHQSVHFAGIGNIAASVYSPTQHHHMVSHNGTVGHEVRKIQEFIYPWYANSLLIMHSDGLSTKWNLDRYIGLPQKHPSLIAGILYRDFYRGRDDVTIVVVKEIEQ